MLSTVEVVSVGGPMMKAEMWRMTWGRIVFLSTCAGGSLVVDCRKGIHEEKIAYPAWSGRRWSEVRLIEEVKRLGKAEVFD